MELVQDNSIIIPEKSQVDTSYGPFYSSQDTYDEINIGSESTFTGSYTFAGVQSEKITINRGCNIAGFGVFSRGFCREIEIHKDTNITGPYSFQYCSHVNRVKFHENCRILANHAFSGCGIRELDFGRGIKVFGTGTFYQCENIEHLVIPDNAFFDSIYTFAKCKNLKSVRCGNNVVFYGHNMFTYCENLEAVYFGDNGSIYGEENFNGCPNLRIIEHGANFLNEDKTLRIFEKPYKRIQFEEIPEGAECSIRMEPFDKSSTVVQTVCGHYFNEECLCEWLVDKTTCPLCRKKLKRE
jgi:hypothetical protein